MPLGTSCWWQKTSLHRLPRRDTMFTLAHEECICGSVLLIVVANVASPPDRLTSFRRAGLRDDFPPSDCFLPTCNPYRIVFITSPKISDSLSSRDRVRIRNFKFEIPLRSTEDIPSAESFGQTTIYLKPFTYDLLTRPPTSHHSQVN